MYLYDQSTIFHVTNYSVTFSADDEECKHWCKEWKRAKKERKDWEKQAANKPEPDQQAVNIDIKPVDVKPLTSTPVK